MNLQLVYEGKSKRVYVKDESTLILEFKDDVTAGDGTVRASAIGKGILCARTSAYFFKMLEIEGVRTHFIEFDGYRRMLVRRLSIVPIEVIVRNYAYGSLMKRMPLYRILQNLDPPLIEFHYKDDVLHDPLVLPEDIVKTGLVTEDELKAIADTALTINRILTSIFSKYGLRFVDLKLEFGRDSSGKLLVADEISGDTFRVIDETGSHLDKEVFRKTRETGPLLKAYIELAKRLGIKVDDIAAPY